MGFALIWLIVYPITSLSAEEKSKNKVSNRALPVMSFFSGNETGYEISVSEGSNIAAIGVQLSEAQPNNVTFTLTYFPFSSTATQPSDFSIPNPDNDGRVLNDIDVTIAAGEDSFTFPINITPNFVFNSENKVIAFTVSNVVGAIAAENELKVTIRDDESPPILQFATANTTITEEVTQQLEIEIELIGSKNGEEIKVNYSLLGSPGMYALGDNPDDEGADYVDPSTLLGFLPGEFTIPAESEEFKFNLEFFNDTIAENQEQLIIKLESTDIARINEERDTIEINVLDGDSTQNKLTDTGVNVCYGEIIDPDNPTIDCSSFDYPSQDGASFSPRTYIKIGEDGRRITGAEEWACIYDVDTGLLWEVKPLDHVDNDKITYSWFNEASTVNGGDEGTEGGQNTCGTPPCDTAKYVDYLNTKNVFGHCGVRKWRLPSVTELLSLVDFQSTDSVLSIDTNYFPRTSRLGSTYWTSTPYSILKDFAWCVDFTKTNFNQVKSCRKELPQMTRLVSTCKLGPSQVECS